MTVPASERKAGPFNGNGSTTAFPFTFKVFTDEDVEVVVADADGVETVLVLDSDYSVSLNADQNATPGGTVTYPISGSPLATGEKLSVVGSVEYGQSTDIPTGGNFNPTVLEDALDKLAMQIQQLQEAIARAAKIPVTRPEDAEALSEAILLAADNITALQAIAASLADIQTVADDLNEPVSEINTVAGSIANVDAVGGSISNVNAVAGNATNINAVAGNATNINAVAGNATNINAVNANSANINAVAGNATNVNTVATNIASVNSAASNMAAIIDAPTQAANAASSATNAANSAALAAAAAASGLYSAVQDKSANYTVVAADAGDLLRVSTGSGAVTITLPLISSVSDGFKVAVVKWTGDTNAVTIARSGSDTINGQTNQTIGSQYTSINFVADFETNQWLAVTSGLGTTNVVVDAFSGTGSQTAFTLSGDPGSENNTQVFVGGVYQEKDTYSVSGTTLTFSAAPPAGTGNIEVVWTQPLAIGTPSDGTVSTNKIQDAAVTAAKMASGAAVSNIGFTPANDSAVVKLTGAQTMSGGKRGTVSALGNTSGTITLDMATANNFSLTLNANSSNTLANPSNLTAGQHGAVVITQDGTGSRTLAYGSNWKFPNGTAPTLTTTASAVDVLAYYVESATRITARLISDVK